MRPVTLIGRWKGYVVSRFVVGSCNLANLTDGERASTPKRASAFGNSQKLHQPHLQRRAVQCSGGDHRPQFHDSEVCRPHDGARVTFRGLRSVTKVNRP